MKLSEKEIVDNFTHILGLPNKTDGSLFIYKRNKGQASKPDGYYYYEGITFILDAKAEGKPFIGQLEDYMKLESNKNFIGFKYNGVIFECYVNGELKTNELVLKDKDYYKNTYFPNKINNEAIVEASAKKLANDFRRSKIDKQMNVPFIGAVMLCLKYNIDIDFTSTATILRSLTIGINTLISDNPAPRKQKKEFIKIVLGDSSLQRAKTEDLLNILQEISTIHNFINISSSDIHGHDIMNSFLKIFRKWNSANTNEKGEVFTPDHIARLMYRIAKCSKDNVILDPTCGSGTFLTNTLASMFSETTDEKELKDIQENRIIGIEVNDFNATLAGINMMLHGDGASNIYREDCFIKLPQLKDIYDRVLMNPPFSIINEPELKFVKVTLDSMKEGGILAAIIPKSCIKGTMDENLTYMKEIFNISKLLYVISLPKDLFYPNAAPNTCIIFLEKTIEGHNGETLLIDCSKDGYISGNDTRIDINNEWVDIEKEIYDAIENNKYNEFRAIKKTLSYKNELLFEAYSSNRSYNIDHKTYIKYIREYIAGKALCGIFDDLFNHNITNTIADPNKYKKFKINTLIEKIDKGKTKSPDRKQENKYLGKTPVIIAKKDNNGIGGTTDIPHAIYKDNFCIVTGGDGGGGKTYYCDFEFSATNFILICKLNQEYNDLADKYAKLYLAITISERLYKTVQHGRSISDVPDIEIELPLDNNDNIHWKYMSNYIKSINK